MEMQQLRYFISIYNNQNLTKAAEECFISVQGISLSVHRLEKELGEKLFIRSSKGIIPTEYADYLFPRAKKILATKDECTQYFSSHKKVADICKISLAQGVMEECAGRLLKQYMDLYPEVNLQIHESTDKICEDDLVYGTSELAMIAGPVNRNEFDAVEMFCTRHALIAPVNSEFAQRDRIEITDLKDIPISILNNENRTYYTLMNLCGSAGIEPNIFFVAEYVLTLFSAVENRLTYGIVSESLAKRQANSKIKVIPIDNDSYLWKIYLIKNKDSSLKPPAKKLWDLMASNGKLNKKSPEVSNPREFDLDF